jgi:hypothetical protein
MICPIHYPRDPHFVELAAAIIRIQYSAEDEKALPMLLLRVEAEEDSGCPRAVEISQHQGSNEQSRKRKRRT